jgi:D-3-phosphoglycerate dehydrogenase
MNKNVFSFPKEKIKVLLLEAIHPEAKNKFNELGYTTTELIAKALPEKELCERIKDVHILGIRSKTMVTNAVIDAATNLLAIGCFCIGTNQVDLDAAAKKGVVVFNAPYSNTRSVAELTIAEIIMLARRAAEKSDKLHKGIWEKSAGGCIEVRGKTLGIVGYGHIGPQVGILAEALGMTVVYYDILPKLSLGNAKPTKTLKELLAHSDFVTLHVPETPSTMNMISSNEIATMKKGAFFLNLARGSLVDVDALAAAVKSGALGGAAVDVFPEEPESNEQLFKSPLCGLPNVILTPHIGGSTAEAQLNIGLEVADALTKYSDTGATTGAVNFPRIDLPAQEGRHRILHIHKNVPGVLRDVNKIIADAGGNIVGQYLGTTADIGYLIMDIEKGVGGQVKTALDSLSSTVRARVLY